jgi:hypothetical protein
MKIVPTQNSSLILTRTTASKSDDDRCVEKARTSTTRAKELPCLMSASLSLLFGHQFHFFAAVKLTSTLMLGVAMSDFLTLSFGDVSRCVVLCVLPLALWDVANDDVVVLVVVSVIVVGVLT